MATIDNHNQLFILALKAPLPLSRTEVQKQMYKGKDVKVEGTAGPYSLDGEEDEVDGVKVKAEGDGSPPTPKAAQRFVHLRAGPTSVSPGRATGYAIFRLASGFQDWHAPVAD